MVYFQVPHRLSLNSEALPSPETTKRRYPPHTLPASEFEAGFEPMSLDEYPSLPRLVQLVLCDDGWARIDAYRVSSTRKAPPWLLICL